MISSKTVFLAKVLYIKFFSVFFKDVFLIFAPDAKWNAAYISLIEISKKLLQDNRKSIVVILRCRKSLPFCVSASALKTDFSYNSKTKHKVFCNKCVAIGNKKDFFSFRKVSLFMLNFEINQAVIPLHRFKKLSLFNVPIGRIVEGEMFRELQVQSFSLRNVFFRKRFLYKMRSCLTVFFNIFVLDRLFNFRAFFYFQDYSYNLTTALFFKNKNTKLFNISHSQIFGIQKDLPVLFEGPRILHSLRLVDQWKHFYDKPLSASQIRIIAYHQLFRMSSKAREVFSPPAMESPKEICNRLSIKSSNANLFYTSSFDEILAIKNWASAINLIEKSHDCFKDQISMIRFLQKSTSSQANKAVLIVRIHPREGSVINQRDKLPFHEYLKAFNKNKNIKLILPNENISSYDLLNVANRVCTGWSSMGFEAAMLGNFVIRGFLDAVPSPHFKIAKYSDRKTDYKQFFVENILASNLIEASLNSFRWFFIEFCSNSFSMQQNYKMSRLQMVFPRFSFQKTYKENFFWHPFQNVSPSKSDFSNERFEHLKALFLFFDFFYKKRYLSRLCFSELTKKRAFWFFDLKLPDYVFSNLSKQEIIRDIELELNLFRNDPDSGFYRQANRLCAMLESLLLKQLF